MAVLRDPIYIKGDVNDCIRYIQNKEKCVADSQTMKLMRYMQSHCIEEIASVGYNGCSGFREVANEQFRLAKARYKESHPDMKKRVMVKSVADFLKGQRKKWLDPKIKVVPPDDAESMMPLKIAIRIWNNTDRSDEERAEAYKVMSAYKVVSEKTENDALHLVIATHRDDNPTPEILQTVLDEFMEHPYFSGFPAVSNLHFDRPHKHGHILLSNYHSSGGVKFSWNAKKEAELKRHLNRICYKHGLSIIDTPELRRDPEYAKWLDDVIAEGKVKVRDYTEYTEIEDFSSQEYNKIESQAHQISSKKIRTRKRRGSQNWKAEYSRKAASYSSAVDAVNWPSDIKEELKDNVRNNLYAGDGRYISFISRSMLPDEKQQYSQTSQAKRTPEAEKEFRRSSRRKNFQDENLQRKYHCVRMYVYDPVWRRYRMRSNIELLFELARIIISKETSFMQDNYPKRYKNFVAGFGEPNRKIQDMLDSISTARKLNVQTPAEMYSRADEIGAAIGKVRKAISYDQATLERGQELYDAVKVWQDKTLPEAERKSAYAVLARNKCTSPEKMDGLVQRYERAKNRLPENEQYLESLRKDYRDAKKAIGTLEVMNAQCQTCHDAAMEASKYKPEFAAQVARAQQQQSAQSNTQQRAPQKKNDNPSYT